MTIPPPNTPCLPADKPVEANSPQTSEIRGRCDSLFAYCPHCAQKAVVKGGRIQEHRVFGSADSWYCPGGAK